MIAFAYGTMGAGKSKTLIDEVCRLRKNSRTVVPAKPRNRSGIISSRDGRTIDCVNIEDMWALPADNIVVDEVQFLTAEEVTRLSSLSKNVDISCYGLLYDYTGKKFPASEYLYNHAVFVVELPSRCWCGKDAYANLKVNVSGLPTEDATSPSGKGNYVVVCHKHFTEKDVGPCLRV